MIGKELVMAVPLEVILATVMSVETIELGVTTPMLSGLRGAIL